MLTEGVLMRRLRGHGRCQQWAVGGLAAAAALLTLLAVLRRSPNPGDTAQPGSGAAAFRYPVWPEFTLPGRSDAWYNSTCFGGRLRPELAALDQNLQLWRAAEEPLCRARAAQFEALFTVELRAANVSLPPGFRQKVLGWMGGSETLLDSVEHQRILHVTNNFDLQGMAFNPARGRRPQPRGAGPGALEQLRAQIESTRADCDFCRYREMTSFEEAFGRPSSEHAVVVGNTFRLDGSHSLVLSREHSLLELSAAAVRDMLALAERWCRQVHALRPELRYPTLVWDVGLHAGMSQMHPHLHVLLAPRHYAGGMERLRRAALQFNARYPDENYFSALAHAHAALGLTARLGRAVALAVVSPLLDLELWVLAAEPGPDFGRLYELAVRTLQRRQGRYCHSAGLALPALDEPAGRLPALARLLARGDCTAVRADVSSLELFAVSSISADPYSMIAALRTTIAEEQQA